MGSTPRCPNARGIMRRRGFPKRIKTVLRFSHSYIVGIVPLSRTTCERASIAHAVLASRSCHIVQFYHLFSSKDALNIPRPTMAIRYETSMAPQAIFRQKQSTSKYARFAPIILVTFRRVPTFSSCSKPEQFQRTHYSTRRGQVVETESRELAPAVNFQTFNINHGRLYYSNTTN